MRVLFRAPTSGHYADVHAALETGVHDHFAELVANLAAVRSSLF